MAFFASCIQNAGSCFGTVRPVLAGFTVLLATALIGAGLRGAAAEPASDAYVVAVHLGSDKPPSTGPEEVSAIRDFVLRRAATINAEGGIAGHRLDIAFFDDQSDGEKTKANVDAALAIPNLIAMVGLWNSTRGQGVMERIGRSGVPLISELSVETLFAPYPNIFTLTRAVRDEQEVFRSFARDGFKKLAFVGAKDDLYTRAYFDRVENLKPDVSLVSTFWLDGSIEDNADAVDRAISDIRHSEADLVFLSIGSKRGAGFLKKMAAAGVAVPVFIGLGSINGIVTGGGAEYEGTLYEIAEGGIANLNNERLEQLMRKPDSLPQDRQYSPYAIGYGARYADLVALIAEAASKSPAPGVETVRNHVTSEVASHSEGERVWRGWAQDWSFTRDRASAERSLLIWRPKGQTGATLAPTQYVRMGGAELTRVPVLYVHLNMVRIFHVDSSDKSFEAEFFFSMRSGRAVPIRDIEFTNAELSQETAQPLINLREVHQQGDAARGEPVTRVYKVNGRFRFEPDLGKYPFDQQIFSISFQPARTSAPFFIQPPSEAVRRHGFTVDGWQVESHYVGTNELIIRSVSANANEERVIPYYNFNYTWVMKRQVVDYVLRVIVPLTFILIVAYIAIFIPRTEFEAIMGIQVTALLSAIALYFALSQPGADDATLSDIIFLMAYAAISAMIVLSVLEVNTTVATSDTALHVIHVIQVYLVPLLALATIGFVIAAASHDLTLRELLGRVFG
ncbi:MAG: ABC transporter substrate-binding protein [Hyphomicrobium sp.]